MGHLKAVTILCIFFAVFLGSSSYIICPTLYKTTIKCITYLPSLNFPYIYAIVSYVSILSFSAKSSNLATLIDRNDSVKPINHSLLYYILPFQYYSLFIKSTFHLYTFVPFTICSVN